MIEPRLTELNQNEILLYLGYRGQEMPAELDAQLDECTKKVMQLTQPRLVYRELPVERDGESLKIAGIELEGEDVKVLLKSCEKVILMAATAGPQVCALISKTQVSDKGSALIMDSCASVAVENICNNFEEDLRAQAEGEGLFLTDRFSPGYGDLPINLQKGICEALNTGRRIGVTVTDSFLMVPSKSVTAIIGLAKEPQPHRASGCEVCRLFRNCTFRKNGGHCGRQAKG